jgi:hypothetical protein
MRNSDQALLKAVLSGATQHPATQIYDIALVVNGLLSKVEILESRYWELINQGENNWGSLEQSEDLPPSTPPL